MSSSRRSTAAAPPPPPTAPIQPAKSISDWKKSRSQIKSNERKIADFIFLFFFYEKIFSTWKFDFSFFLILCNFFVFSEDFT
jgi:hypothetical protein